MRKHNLQQFWFSLSRESYRYEPSPNRDNEIIADWLICLTENRRNWGFGLCFLYLRNVKGYPWNHKAGLPDIPATGTQSADQTEETIDSREAGAISNS